MTAQVLPPLAVNRQLLNKKVFNNFLVHRVVVTAKVKAMQLTDYESHCAFRQWKKGRGLAEWSEGCASVPKVTGSNPSGGSELTFRSGLLLWYKCLPKFL
jgi:hypothetical protein